MKNKIITILALSLFTYQAEAKNNKDLDKLIDQRVEKIIMEKPELIIQSLEKLQQRQQAAVIEEIQKRAELHYPKMSAINENTGYIGNPKAKNVIVEYFDYNCGHCKAAAKHLGELVAHNNDIVVILHDLPILGESSQQAARISEAVKQVEPTKFKDFYFALMAKDRINSEEEIINIAAEQGISKKKLKAALKNKELDQTLQNNLLIARETGLRGTPSFFVNGKFFTEPFSKETVQKYLQK